MNDLLNKMTSTDNQPCREAQEREMRRRDYQPLCHNCDRIAHLNHYGFCKECEWENENG